jgi:hypothetical protein
MSHTRKGTLSGWMGRISILHTLHKVGPKAVWAIQSDQCYQPSLLLIGVTFTMEAEKGAPCFPCQPPFTI